MDKRLLWFVYGTVLGPLFGYVLLGVWLWLWELAGQKYRAWKRKRGPQ